MIKLAGYSFVKGGEVANRADHLRKVMQYELPLFARFTGQSKYLYTHVSRIYGIKTVFCARIKQYQVTICGDSLSCWSTLSSSCCVAGWEHILKALAVSRAPDAWRMKAVGVSWLVGRDTSQSSYPIAELHCTPISNVESHATATDFSCRLMMFFVSSSLLMLLLVRPEYSTGIELAGHVSKPRDALKGLRGARSDIQLCSTRTGQLLGLNESPYERRYQSIAHEVTDPNSFSHNSNDFG